MNVKIMLLRHVESLKNTLQSVSSIDGKEPITKYGYYQMQNIVSHIKSYFPDSESSNTRVFCSDDVRSYDTATAIAQTFNCKCIISSVLAAFTDKYSEGLLVTDALTSDEEYAHNRSLYRAGLISAYDIPWPSFDIKKLEGLLDNFVDNIIAENSPSIIVAHKSSLTCLALNILKRFGKYPRDFYGYVDIPLGSGLLFEIANDRLDWKVVSFFHKQKTTHTDVIVRNGQILFPESACAVCFWENELLLVQQERNSRLVWELPGGKIKDNETPIEAALRELSEESGYTGDAGGLLLSTDLDLSISIHKTHLVNVNNLIKTECGKLHSKWFSETELRKMINCSEITHVQTGLAFLLRYKF